MTIQVSTIKPPNNFSFIRTSRFAITGMVVILTIGCPSPPLFKTWVKLDATENDVKRAMLDCGFPNIAGTTHQNSRNDAVKMYQCMGKLGFQNKTNFDICSFNSEIPACVEEKQGYPVSVAQLESLPFNDDPGFYPIRPNSNLTPHNLISWRLAKSSQHYSERISNQDIAIVAMYECGYPNPLGSGSPANIGTTARVQMCMQEKGFIPDQASIHTVTMIPVCKQYPILPTCQSPVMQNRSN